ncbi:MAG: threonylcarbamoyl-AMP synthase [Candidatus Saganbacteria bacterium]|nr:threonylcarbamoyl-AMP synthase [Candidatus Saganbacteria bacterium]
MMNQLKKAVKTLKTGGVIAFPTETVYGLGALLKNKKAIARIFAIKNRPKTKPLQILVASLEQAKKLGKFNKKALALAEKYWPGPLTLIVGKKRAVPKLVTGGRSTVGLRIPDHKLALELIKKCGPLAATSANLAGERPALTAKEAAQKFPALRTILPGRARSGKASKVVDATDGFRVLRGG